MIQNCSECQQPYRTFVPDSICKIPGGGCVTCQDPQLLCPECDPNNYGIFMNEDLFPHMVQAEDIEVESS